MEQLVGDRQQAWFRALDHARLAGVKPTYNIAGDYYTVRSPASGNIYVQTRDNHYHGCAFDCTCRAAYAGHVCWHRALVMALPHERIRRALKMVGLE